MSAPGPNPATTNVGDNIKLKLSSTGQVKKKYNTKLLEICRKSACVHRRNLALGGSLTAQGMKEERRKGRMER